MKGPSQCAGYWCQCNDYHWCHTHPICGQLRQFGCCWAPDIQGGGYVCRWWRADGVRLSWGYRWWWCRQVSFGSMRVRFWDWGNPQSARGRWRSTLIQLSDHVIKCPGLTNPHVSVLWINLCFKRTRASRGTLCYRKKSFELCMPGWATCLSL